MFLDVVNGTNLPTEPVVILGGRVEQLLDMLLTVAVRFPVSSDPPLTGELLDGFVSSTANLRI